MLGFLLAIHGRMIEPGAAKLHSVFESQYRTMKERVAGFAALGVK